MIAEFVSDPVSQAALHAAAALLFLTAAVHKGFDPAGFRGALAGYEILPKAWVASTAAAIAVGELAVGVACAVPATAATGCAAGAALLCSYTLAVAWNLSRGRRSIDCGCGGPGGERPLSPGLVARNTAVVALLAVGALPDSGRALVWLDFVSVAGALALLAVVYAAVDVALANATRLRALREPS